MEEISYIGILITHSLYEKLKKGTVITTLKAYEEAGKQFNLKPIYLRSKDFDTSLHQISGLIIKDSTIQQMTINIPPVIYNRSSIRSKDLNYLLKHNIYIYNTKRFGNSKYKMHKIIARNRELRPNLPVTRKGTPKALTEMMEKYDRLIIKPCYGSIGKGIMKLEKNKDNEWLFSFPNKDEKWESILFTRNVPDILVDKLQQEDFIIQEKLQLATFNNRPFDLRVTVQRNEKGEWSIPGIIAKVAANGHFLTNIGQGGSSKTFEDIMLNHPTLSYEKVLDDITAFALKIAKHLEHFTYHIADLGLDIAITEDGIPYFIECNFRSTYGTVHYKGKRYEEWMTKHFNPIGYARYLIDQSEK